MENEQKKTIAYHRFFFIISLVLFGLILINSRFFAVEKIIVINNYEVPTEKILTTASIKAGQSIFFVNPTQIKKDILKNPLLAAIDVKLQLPNKVLLIVTERKPLCLVTYSKQTLIIAEDGVIIGFASPSTKLPLITGIAPKKPEMGEKINANRFKEACQLLSFADIPLRRMLQEINLKSYQLSIKDRQFPDGIIVELGNNQEMGKKIANLRAILLQPHSEGIIGIDLRSPAMPTILTSGKK